MAEWHKDVQSLDMERVVDLYEVDASSITGGGITRYHDGKNELLADVVFNGDTFLAWPIFGSGFARVEEGVLPRPKLKVANVSGVIGALCDSLEDLLGAKVTRFRIQVKFLDAVNFTGGVNADANPAERVADEIWYVNQKLSQDSTWISFELASLMDVDGVKLPRRVIVRNICTWQYRSSECSYAGGAVGEIDDTPTVDINLDDCGKRLASCKLRFGDNGTLPFGGFPGVGIVR